MKDVSREKETFLVMKIKLLGTRMKLLKEERFLRDVDKVFRARRDF